MQIPVLAATLAAFAPIMPLPQVPAEEQPYYDVAEYLERRFEETGVPGAAYSIVDLDGNSYSVGWGADGSGDPVDLGTPFLWGSVAKPVTAAAVMTLVEDGRLDLDAPVTDYLPDFTLADQDRSDRITVRDLLRQTTGIPEGTGLTDRFDHHDDPYGDAVADLADVEPISEPGESFEYASANYVVAGAVVEAAAGMPYEQYLHEAVLDPLGMIGAVTTAEDAADVPRGHAVAFGQPFPVKTRFDQTGPSYGYLGGNIQDLTAFAVDQLGGSAILTPESAAETHTGAIEVNDTVDYGLGWRVDSRNADLGTATVWHTGGAPGFSAGVILLPELGRAVVVAQNRYGYFEDAALIGTMLGAARMLAGGDPVEPESDPLYPSLLAGLCVLLLAALAAVYLTFLRLGKARKANRPLTITGMACWVLAALATAYVSFALVPGLAPSRAAFFGMMPDIAWLFTALGVAALVTAAVRVWAGTVRLRRTPH
ncbi:serine hydrolase domain-containing protein [Glycomyces artemisiae]|uniref:CubicO group peptidase (Beta-lactamase class C family) n=1 Tax=Glycomyces artemisiae TaxID=1076443 RepID=A0A2T0UG93_9ACTN|nr:serine hydrolase domain-containing protein [Glycomyces artemisiae]PRY56973.1 CubicO group peptidase (beta-lactamase class C family) [Glycomyces artemisiae]